MYIFCFNHLGVCNLVARDLSTVLEPSLPLISRTFSIAPNPSSVPIKLLLHFLIAHQSYPNFNPVNLHILHTSLFWFILTGNEI